MARLPSFDAAEFFTFGNPYQAYFVGLEQLSQGAEPLKGPLKAAARCQLEALGLMSRRTQAYMQFGTRLVACRTPQDYLNEQMAFWRTAFEQYSESSRRMVEAWSSLNPAAAMPAVERDFIAFPGEPETGRPASRRLRVA